MRAPWRRHVITRTGARDSSAQKDGPRQDASDLRSSYEMSRARGAVVSRPLRVWKAWVQKPRVSVRLAPDRLRDEVALEVGGDLRGRRAAPGGSST